MEYAIEQKVISMLDAGLRNQNDNTPAFILPYAEDWQDYNDFPSIVVQVDEEVEDNEQVANLPSFTKAYMLSIFVITVDDLWEDVTYQRGLLKTRIQTIMKGNRTLDLLEDSDSTEKVFSSKYVGTEFSTGGFNSAWQSYARIKYEIWTEVKP